MPLKMHVFIFANFLCVWGNVYELVLTEMNRKPADFIIKNHQEHRACFLEIMLLSLPFIWGFSRYIYGCLADSLKSIQKHISIISFNNWQHGHLLRSFFKPSVLSVEAPEWQSAKTGFVNRDVWQNCSHFANDWFRVAPWVWMEQLVSLL